MILIEGKNLILLLRIVVNHKYSFFTNSNIQSQ